jgi:hypothetical protein
MAALEELGEAQQLAHQAQFTRGLSNICRLNARFATEPSRTVLRPSPQAALGKHDAKKDRGAFPRPFFSNFGCLFFQVPSKASPTSHTQPRHVKYTEPCQNVRTIARDLIYLPARHRLPCVRPIVLQLRNSSKPCAVTLGVCAADWIIVVHRAPYRTQCPRHKLRDQGLVGGVAT